MVCITKQQRRDEYSRRLIKYVSTYDKCLVVCADFVRSSQMQKIRFALRGKAEMIFGKNTKMRKIIKNQNVNNSKIDSILNLLRYNVGLIFTRNDVAEIRELLKDNRMSPYIRAGVIAQSDVVVKAQQTNLAPESTVFFQALNIQTKINKGKVEIINDIDLIKKGNIVGESETALLRLLDIKPFTYGLVVRQVYDNGSVYGPEILDINQDAIISKVMAAANNLMALSLGIGYPTVSNVAYMLNDALKNLIAFSVESDYEFKESRDIKEYLKDPAKFVVAVTDVPEEVIEVKTEIKKEVKAESEKEESEEEDFGLCLFD